MANREHHNQDALEGSTDQHFARLIGGRVYGIGTSQRHGIVEGQGSFRETKPSLSPGLCVLVLVPLERHTYRVHRKSVRVKSAAEGRTSTEMGFLGGFHLAKVTGKR